MSATTTTTKTTTTVTTATKLPRRPSYSVLVALTAKTTTSMTVAQLLRLHFSSPDILSLPVPVRGKVHFGNNFANYSFVIGVQWQSNKRY